MFHRFSETAYATTDLYNRSLYISADNLLRTIADFRKLGYHFSELNGNNVKKDNQVFVTIDDGYADILRVALPIFKNESVPFTIFCNTKLVKKQQIAWWEAIEFLDESEKLFLKNKLLAMSSNQSQRDLDLRELVLDLSIENYHIFLNNLESLISPEQIASLKNLFLNEEQLSNLSESPLCLIGSHSMTHYNMSKLSPELLKEEIELDQKYLSSLTAQLSEYFCIPYGSKNECDNKIFDTARALGFSGCLTTEHGSVQRTIRTDVLRRLYISNDFTLESLRRLQQREYIKRLLRIRIL